MNMQDKGKEARYLKNKMVFLAGIDGRGSDSDPVPKFLRRRLVYWIECFHSLLKSKFRKKNNQFVLR